MKKDLFISENTTIKDALGKLNITAEKLLFVVDVNNKFLGTLSDGDIRRAILADFSFDISIKDVYCKRSIYIKIKDYNVEVVKELMIKSKIEVIPILDEDMKVSDYITWESIFKSEKKNIRFGNIDIPVVIMAGGKGARMEPFTTILPKPLIPIGDKSILELIMNEFNRFGVKEFYLTLNYKGEMIKAYFDSIKHSFMLNYIWEKDFYGTAGSLKYLFKENISDTFIVSNCDIIVKADYNDMLKFHKDNKAGLTVVSCLQRHTVPYGVIEFKNGGEITEIKEKPEFVFTVNTGMYLLQKEILEYIPDKTIFHMTDLITCLIEKKIKVLTYPVNDNDYIDIGQWEEYHKSIDKLRIL